MTLCGLYLALNFLLERMTVEGECDVISAVRAVRRSKTDFVQSSVRLYTVFWFHNSADNHFSSNHSDRKTFRHFQGQFEQLYEAAVNYHELFKTYANFS